MPVSFSPNPVSPAPEGLAFFGQQGAFDRAAHLRSDPDALARMKAAPGTRVLPVWRGRIPFAQAGLAFVTLDTPLLNAGPGPMVFLGLVAGEAMFACDISEVEMQGEDLNIPAFLDRSEQTHPDLPPGMSFAEIRARLPELTPLQSQIAATARVLCAWHRSHRFCAACGAQTEAAEAGWTRRCPQCGATHFPRTDPVVIMLVTRGNQVLLGRGRQWPEGMYSCLAGFMEPGETVEAAVRREVFEETGVRVGPVRMIATQPWPFPASLMIGCHARAEGERITLDENELQDALWISRERLMEAMAGTDPVIRPPRPGAIAGWLLREWLADRRV